MEPQLTNSNSLRVNKACAFKLPVNLRFFLNKFGLHLITLVQNLKSLKRTKPERFHFTLNRDSLIDNYRYLQPVCICISWEVESICIWVQFKYKYIHVSSHLVGLVHCTLYWRDSLRDGPKTKSASKSPESCELKTWHAEGKCISQLGLTCFFF